MNESGEGGIASLMMPRDGRFFVPLDKRQRDSTKKATEVLSQSTTERKAISKKSTGCGRVVHCQKQRLLSVSKPDKRLTDL